VQPFYLADAGDAKTGIGHFHEKLFKLKSLMNTDAGRRMAEDPERFVRTLLGQSLKEENAAQRSPIDDIRYSLGFHSTFQGEPSNVWVG
jgi:hypothetical protein